MIRDMFNYLRDFCGMADVRDLPTMRLTFESERDLAVFRRAMIVELSPMVYEIGRRLDGSKFDGIPFELRHKERRWMPDTAAMIERAKQIEQVMWDEAMKRLRSRRMADLPDDRSEAMMNAYVALRELIDFIDGPRDR